MAFFALILVYWNIICKYFFRLLSVLVSAHPSPGLQWSLRPLFPSHHSCLPHRGIYRAPGSLLLPSRATRGSGGLLSSAPFVTEAHSLPVLYSTATLACKAAGSEEEALPLIAHTWIPQGAANTRQMHVADFYRRFKIMEEDSTEHRKTETWLIGVRVLRFIGLPCPREFPTGSVSGLGPESRPHSFLSSHSGHCTRSALLSSHQKTHSFHSWHLITWNSWALLC